MVDSTGASYLWTAGNVTLLPISGNIIALNDNGSYIMQDCYDNFDVGLYSPGGNASGGDLYNSAGQQIKLNVKNGDQTVTAGTAFSLNNNDQSAGEGLLFSRRTP